MNNILIQTTQEYTNGISGPQGALYHNGLIYQFQDGGNCKVLNSETYAQVSQFTLPAYSDSGSNPHCSSVEWIVPGQKIATTTCSTGLVGYANKVYIYDITDTSNITQDVVTIQCTDSSKYARMGCLAYDQTNKVLYVAGYTSGSAKLATSPCWFESFDMSDYIDNGSLVAPLILQTETSGAGLHLQDGGFHNGYLYYLCDNSNTTNSNYDGLYVWVLSPTFQTIAIFNVKSDNVSEAEAFFLKPNTHSLDCICSTVLNRSTYYNLHFGYYTAPEPSENPIHLHKTLNIDGYVVNGVNQYDDCVMLPYGTYTVSPILKPNVVFNEWSDGSTDLTRTVSLEGSGELELSAYAIHTTVYLYALPQKSNYGTSVYAGTEGNFYLTLNAASNRLNEYVMAANIKYNDNDRDITIQGADMLSTKAPVVTTQYFTPLGITEGMYYFTEIPHGYNYLRITYYNNNTPLDDTLFGSRNPNFFICGANDFDTMVKIYGNTDVYRPETNGNVYDLSALKCGTGGGSIVNCTTIDYKYRLISTRLDTTLASHDVSKVKLEFFKTMPTE